MEALAPVRPPVWLRKIYPRSQWTADDPESITLTFDDGPGPLTLPLLDWADIHKAQFYFFLSPQQATEHKSVVRRLHNERHLVGSHFLRHIHYWHRTKQRFQNDLRKSCTIIEDIIGAPVRYCRVPYGRLAPWQEPWISELDLTHVFWSLDSRDYIREPVKSVIQRLKQYLQPGDMVLMHDGQTYHPHLMEILKYIEENKGMNIGL